MKIQLSILTFVLLAGCSDSSTPVENITDDSSHTLTPTNRVAIPLAVRSNLGITFATVERRQLQDTLRAPGRFEYLPSAKREYQTMFSGKIDLLVDQFETIEEGQPLFQITSPQWREMQQNIAELLSNMQQLDAKMEMYNPVFLAHEQHEYSVKVNIEMWEERIKTLKALREAGGGSLREFTTASAACSAARAEYADLQEEDARLEAAYADTLAANRSAKSKFNIALESASAMLNIKVSADDHDWWRDISSIVIFATNAGVVEALNVTNGAWANAQTTVLTIVQPNKLRFHASGLQSDLGTLKDGLQVNIVPPTSSSSGHSVNLQNTMHGALQLGLTGDSNKRTIDLYVTPEKLSSWARPGVTAQLEIITDSTSETELAIPLSAVQQDGLTQIIFRRNPSNPNEAIRMEADLGLDDGKWIAVLSGLRDGDEVVLDGGFQLMLATSGSIQKGGHFHADGTFHEGEH
jgi:multidrug efflux pump subunit AcrA (membrane-fusion protein)